MPDYAEKFLQLNKGRDPLAVKRAGEALPGQGSTIGASPLDRRGPFFGVPPQMDVPPQIARQRAQALLLRQPEALDTYVGSRRG